MRQRASAPEQVADLVRALHQQVKTLQTRARELERRLGQNSGKSGKPPSSDGYRKPAPKSLRGNRGRPFGGQPGHSGHRLEFRASPDHVMAHRRGVCRGRGDCLPAEAPGDTVDRRQVFELVARVDVTAHRVDQVRCACCGEVTRGALPLAVSAPTPYGTGMKAPPRTSLWATAASSFRRTAPRVPTRRGEPPFRHASPWRVH